LGLNELSPFEPQKRVIEYLLESEHKEPLLNLNLRQFADETASESPAPGGGSIAAYVGALGAALATMVANLSAHKRGWDDKWAFFSKIAAIGQHLKDALLKKVDEDTAAFNALMAAMQLPKSTEKERIIRKSALKAATIQAIEVPLSTAELSMNSFEILKKMAESGNPASVSDAGVGALCARAAVHGAILNVKINLSGFDDVAYVKSISERGTFLTQSADKAEAEIMHIVHSKIKD
jgi:glutamate formiminotransferase/formiminotetrahydrofolate cyclodeaminase